MPFKLKSFVSQTVLSRCQNWAFPLFCLSTLFIIVFSVGAIHNWPSYIKWPSILLACTLPTGVVALGWAPTWFSERRIPKDILWALLIFSLALTSSLLSENPWATLKASVLFMVSGPFIFLSAKYIFESTRAREAYLWMSSLAMPGLCFMGAYRYYSSGVFHIFAKNPLPDLGLLLLLSASPLILLRKEQPFAFRLVLSLILILFATVVILSAKKGPLVSLLAISFCLICLNFRKYYKFLLFLVVLAGLFLNFSTGAMQKFKGTALGIANLIFVEPDYSRIIYEQIWAQDQARKYVWKTWSDLNKTASSALPLEERAMYKKMLKDRNARLIYIQIWSIDHTGSYTFKSRKDFDQPIWNSLSAENQEVYRKMLKDRNARLIYIQIWSIDHTGSYEFKNLKDFDQALWNLLSATEQETYRKIFKARDGQWPKVAPKTNAASRKELNAMPYEKFLELNIPLRYWGRLSKGNMRTMQNWQVVREDAKNANVIYDQIWNKDQAGKFTLKDESGFDLHAWSSLHGWEKGVLRKMLKFRDGQWPKVDPKTNAASLEKLNAMPDKHLLENNIFLRYWDKLDQDSFRKMQAKLAIMKNTSMPQSRNEIPVVNLDYGPQKKHFLPSTTETILGPIPHVDTKSLWSFTLRIEHYFFAFHLFKKSPVWGLGFKANLVQHLDDYDPYFLSLLTKNTYKGYVKWHQTFENIILMHLVERGGLFTFTYFGGIAYILIGCAKEIRTYPQENIAGMLTIIILTGFLVLSLTFDTLRFPSLNWIFHSLLGLLINLVTKRSHENSKNSLRL